MSLLETILGSEQNRQVSSPPTDTEANFDAASVLGKETPQFSCTGIDDERKLIVTKSRVILVVNNRGTSIPIPECSVDFGTHNGGTEYRITVKHSGSGYGLRINKSDFEQFWNIYSNLIVEE